MGGDEVRRLQGSGSTSGQYHSFGISANDSDPFYLGFTDRKDSIVIFEEDNRFGRGPPQERGVFFILMGTLLSIAFQDLPPMINPY